jgi:hypothetical protein
MTKDSHVMNNDTIVVERFMWACPSPYPHEHQTLSTKNKTLDQTSLGPYDFLVSVHHPNYTFHPLKWGN